MTDFELYDAATHPEVKLVDDYNNIVDHALRKPHQFMVYKNPDTGKYEAQYGSGADQAGKIFGTPNADLQTVIQDVLDNGLTAGRTSKEKVVIKTVGSITSAIDIPSYTQLEIQGKLTRTTATEYLLDIDGKSNVDILHGVLDGNNLKTHLCRVNNSVDVLFAFCKLQNVGFQVPFTYGSGILCDSATNVTVFASVLTDIAGEAVAFADYTAYGRVIHCYIYTTRTAVAVNTATYSYLFGNLLSVAKRNMVNLYCGGYSKIIGNVFTEAGTETNNTYMCIEHTAASHYNIITANSFYQPTVANKAKYAINIPITEGHNIVTSNHFSVGWGTAPIFWTAPNCVVDDNDGCYTKKSGEATGTGAQQTIAHGLHVTPNRVQVSNLDDGANPYQSAAVDATNIYITAVDTKKYLWKAWREL